MASARVPKELRMQCSVDSGFLMQTAEFISGLHQVPILCLALNRIRVTNTVRPAPIELTARGSLRESELHRSCQDPVRPAACR